MVDPTDTHDQIPDFDTIQELRLVSQQWVTGCVERDIAMLDHMMADDFVFTYPLDGDDKKQFLSDIASGELRVEFFERKDVNIRIYGNSAVINCLDCATWNYKGRKIEGDYRTLQVYYKRDDRWQLAAAQSCPLAH